MLFETFYLKAKKLWWNKKKVQGICEHYGDHIPDWVIINRVVVAGVFPGKDVMELSGTLTCWWH